MSIITLKDISRVSGYSVSTVSKALNDKFDVNSDTKIIIREIAKKYNYVPNTYAIALRKKRTKTISVIIPQINTSFYSCFLFHIEKMASLSGYRIMLFQSFENIGKEKEFIDTSNDGSVDGVVIVSNNKRPDPHHFVDNTLPIEYIEINQAIPKEQLKKESVARFTTLLNRIL
ncbi:MAG: LacI family DNA-binding transcriptional regulator [Psychroserpens sp.]|uniref:LacI family DNA-binding transcriptional regulator n=1 Tax=Psychroserpens sp. TaxID=2020870 RepID=UPI003CBC11F8